jgi:hypothetical protein
MRTMLSVANTISIFLFGSLTYIGFAIKDNNVYNHIMLIFYLSKAALEII